MEQTPQRFQFLFRTPPERWKQKPTHNIREWGHATGPITSREMKRQHRGNVGGLREFGLVMKRRSRRARVMRGVGSNNCGKNALRKYITNPQLWIRRRIINSGRERASVVLSI